MAVVTATIADKSGKAMDPAYQLLSIDIEREVNRVPRCSLRLIDGDIAKGTFPISDTKFFEPGAEISVKLRYERKDSKDALVFKGLVVRHGLEMSLRGSVLNVELKDKAVALTQPRRSAVHIDSTDADVISTLAKAAGLTADKLATTKPKHPQLVQYHASDWDFILARAEAQGLVFAVTDGTFTLAATTPAGAAAHTFTFGKDELFSVELEADGLHQPSAVQGVAWDLATAAVTATATATAVKNPLGNLDGDAVATALGFPETTLSSPVPLDPDELKAWADGRMARCRMSMVRGRLATRGFAEVKLLDVVALAGMGARFNGTSVVTGIRHRVSTGGWQTDLQLGFSPELFGQQSRASEAPAAGLLPAVSGLQVGIVDAFEADPQKALRIKVILPGIDPKQGAVWARLATPDAGAGRGYLFRPEQGDEVVVGFFNSDPRQPVILGGMFGKQNPGPKDLGDPTENNLLKGIVSRTGVKIVISDDDKPMVYIETPGKNRIVFDDNNKLIELSDQHGNKVTLDDKGITITSAKDLTLDASGKVVIKGSATDVQ